MTLRSQCLEHASKLEPHAHRYGESAPSAHEGPELWESLVEKVRHTMSDVMARRPASGLLLLRDLRQLYHMAHEVSLYWGAIGQAAQAVRDRGLLEATTEMHEQTLTQIKWITTKLRETSPQVLVVG
jgi:hypothetical protein